MATEPDLAQFQSLSDEYSPDLEGDLAEELQSTQALIAEFKHADAVFVRKTEDIARRFSHYRKMKRDGNCGWRAVALGYFEVLLRSRDPGKISSEIKLFKENYAKLIAAGLEEADIEPYYLPCIDLLNRIAGCRPGNNGAAMILAAFNDPELSFPMVYYFRVLTGAWMRAHADHYAGFLPDVDVENYVKIHIDPACTEIDNVGLQALATAAINESRIAIEVIYLDRSASDEVNTHKFQVIDDDGSIVENTPTIRLLYRPGHYDLLYEAEEVALLFISSLAQPEVRYVAEQPLFITTETMAMANESNLDPLMNIPGLTHTGAPSLFMMAAAPHQCHFGLPARSSMSPSTVEGNPSESQTPSTKSLAFRKSKIQDDYEKYEMASRAEARARGRSEQSRSPVSPKDSTDASKLGDPAHFTNEAFQPQIWRPESDSDKGSGRETTLGKRSS